MKIKCLVVDDEQLARKLITSYLEKLPYLELAGECKNAFEAMDALQKQEIDLMFLDIQMPDLTGLELLHSLNHKPVVIFTTAYQEYALEGFQLDVVDYMLKPVAFERFIKGVNKAVELIRLRKGNTGRPTKEKQIVSSAVDEFINLKADHKIYKVRLKDILYVEGLREYVTFYTAGRKYIVLESLKKLEDSLPAPVFMRIHKSYIINTEHLVSLYGNQVQIGEGYVPIGKSYAEEVKRRLFSIE